MKTLRVVSEATRSLAIRQLVEEKLPFTVRIEGAGRSQDANRLSFHWYNQIGRLDPEHNSTTARRFSKLAYGVPIMREVGTFQDAWDRIPAKLPYEQRLEIMDWWPVTSLMTVTQFSRYLDAVAAHWAEKGVLLMGRDEMEPT